MFIDKVRIYVKAGKGGDGCLSFRREMAVPLGGPDGGSGGCGGNIYLESDPNRTTLIDFTYTPHFKGHVGESGKGKNKQGKDADDIIIYVPCGSVIYKNNQFLHDLQNPYERILVAKGGRGGRGNASFKTHTNTAPYMKEHGEPGEEAVLDLNLKVIADVGLVGLPNAGKSTLLARISKAHPLIADYPFTTLTPNLGVVTYKGNSFIVADIPGLIEGAHSGKGLGFEFLKHVERTRVLVHIIDMSGFDGKDAFENFNIIQKELTSYGEHIIDKPMLVAMNKADVTGFEKNKEIFLKKLKKKKVTIPCYPISAVTGEGISVLLNNLLVHVKKVSQKKESINIKPIPRYTLEREFNVRREGAVFVVTGTKVEHIVAMTPMELDESVRRMQNIFKKMGLDEDLRKHGIKSGDLVRIGTIEFEWHNS